MAEQLELQGPELKAVLPWWEGVAGVDGKSTEGLATPQGRCHSGPQLAIDLGEPGCAAREARGKCEALYLPPHEVGAFWRQWSLCPILYSVLTW